MHAPGGSTSMLVRFPIRMLVKMLMSMLLMVSRARAHGACASTTTLRKSASRQLACSTHGGGRNSQLLQEESKRGKI